MQVTQLKPMGSPEIYQRPMNVEGAVVATLPQRESDDLDAFDSLATEMTLAAKELLIGDRDVLAQHTQSVLSDLGISYRDQEHRTGVTASIVFAMANGKPCHLAGVQRFAAFAADRARSVEARDYWKRLLSRLDRDERRRLTHTASEAPTRKPAETLAPKDVSAIAPKEIAALYSALLLPQNRSAVVHLIRALQAAESVNALPVGLV